MNERDFQNAVIRLAMMYSWRHYHTHDSRRSSPGFPDLVLVRPPRLIFAELKQDGKNPTLAQQMWLDDLEAVGRPQHVGVPGNEESALHITLGAKVEVYVWRPADLDSLPGILKR